MAEGEAKPRLEIRKYPNRRLYDVTRSRHLTADDLYELIREGHDVVVIDSASGGDITHQILAQMILERDSSKLEVFPTTLLHEIIRANQRMWKAFAEQWMSGVTRLVADQANTYAQRIFGKLDAAAKQAAESSVPGAEDLRETVRRLEAQVKRLARARRSRQRRS
jgi:polyhydroxyalkanoate synthesis repressor PhaR